MQHQFFEVSLKECQRYVALFPKTHDYEMECTMWYLKILNFFKRTHQVRMPVLKFACLQSSSPLCSFPTPLSQPM